MIFVTVGTQIAFDRLIQTIDAWASERPESSVFAQIGPSAWKPTHLDWKEFISPEEFTDRSREASVLVAHAGMGSILTAMRLGKPIVIMPRRAELGEQRNDHQLATAARFRDKAGVHVALDEIELRGLLDHLDELEGGAVIGPHASASLLQAVSRFIDGKSW